MLEGDFPTLHAEAQSATTLSFLAFSPNGSLLASIGSIGERGLVVWELCGGPVAAAAGSRLRCAAVGKLSQRVLSAAWLEGGSRLVTAGALHLKFWDMLPVIESCKKWGEAVTQVTASGGYNHVTPRSPLAALAAAVPRGPGPMIHVKSKAAVLQEAGAQFECFVDCAGGCGWEVGERGRVYALSSLGVLCCFDASTRMLEQWVSMRCRAGFSLDVSPGGIAVGGTDGIVRIFAPGTLAFQGTLPLPPALGTSHITVADPLPASSGGGGTLRRQYSGSLALRFLRSSPVDGEGSTVASTSTVCRTILAVYGDRTMLAWDFSDFSRPLLTRAALGHSSHVTSVVPLPASSNSYPDGSFLTASCDGMVRIWNMSTRASLPHHRPGSGGLLGNQKPSQTRISGEFVGGGLGDDGGSTRNASSAAAAAAATLQEGEETNFSPLALPMARPRNIYMRELLGVVYPGGVFKTSAPSSVAPSPGEKGVLFPFPPSADFCISSASTQAQHHSLSFLNASFDVELVSAAAATQGEGRGVVVENKLCIAVDATGTLLAVGGAFGEDSSVFIYSLLHSSSSPSLIAAFPHAHGHQSPPEHLHFTPSGYLFSAGADGTVRLFYPPSRVAAAAGGATWLMGDWQGSHSTALAALLSVSGGGVGGGGASLPPGVKRKKSLGGSPSGHPPSSGGDILAPNQPPPLRNSLVLWM